MTLSPGTCFATRTTLRALPVCAVALSGVAVAEPGDHIRIGNTEVVPDLDIGFEYRSNVYHEEVDPQGGANLRVAPGIQITAEGEEHRFSFGGEYEARKQIYVAFDEADVPPALGATFDQSTAVNSLDRWNDFTADAAVNLFRASQLGFDITDKATYRNNVVDSDFSESPYMTTFRNALEGQIRFKPSSAIEIKGGGLWQYDDYRVPEFFGVALTDENEHDPFNSRHMYGPSLSVGWSFFPNTALVLEGRYLMSRWAVDEIPSQTVDPVLGTPGVTVAKPDSNSLRLAAGLRGRITEKLRMDLLAGYGTADYVGGSPAAATDLAGLQRLIITAQLGYLIREGSALAIGYRRDFADVFFTNYMSSDFFFLQADTKLSDLAISARYGVRLERYEGAITRDDVFNRAALDLGYSLSDWAKLGAGVFYQARYSTQDLVEYDDVGVHLETTFTY